jgi:hypothetical protein
VEIIDVPLLSDGIVKCGDFADPALSGTARAYPIMNRLRYGNVAGLNVVCIDNRIPATLMRAATPDRKPQ